MLSALAESTLLILPPKTGEALMAAFSMPGSLISAPYTCLPVSLSAVSSRLSGLPMIFQSFGSLSGTSFGASSFAAASATLPKLVLRLEALCVMTPLETAHSEAGTFQPSAAACTSMMRAAAPPLRT